jgi:hypothetical protein
MELLVGILIGDDEELPYHWLKPSCSATGLKGPWGMRVAD